MRVSANSAGSCNDNAALGSTAGGGLQKKIVDGGAVEIGVAMSASPGLTESQRALLMAVDAVMVQGTPHAHVLAARQIVSLWSEQHSVFQSQLITRAEFWRRRQIKLTNPVPDPSGDCGRLMNLIALPSDASPGVPARRRNTKRGPGRPDARKLRKPITDAEVERFMDLLDREGIDTVFDPNVTVVHGTAFRRPLIVLEQVPVQYESIIRPYELGTIERGWDTKDRAPEVAVAFDLVLLATSQAGKWTWQIADQRLGLLPQDHPYRSFAGERPGWKPLTRMLEMQGLIERRRGHTWRLSGPAKDIVIEQLAPTWLAAVKPGTN